MTRGVERTLGVAERIRGVDRIEGVDPRRRGVDRTEGVVDRTRGVDRMRGVERTRGAERTRGVERTEGVDRIRGVARCTVRGAERGADRTPRERTWASTSVGTQVNAARAEKMTMAIRFMVLRGIFGRGLRVGAGATESGPWQPARSVPHEIIANRAVSRSEGRFAGPPEGQCLPGGTRTRGRRVGAWEPVRPRSARGAPDRGFGTWTGNPSMALTP